MAAPTNAELALDHAMIDCFARDLSRLIETEAPPAKLAEALSRLAKTVADHLDREDATIYDLAMRATPGMAAGSVERVQREFETLKDNWGRYLRVWTATEIAEDRDGFVRATRAMLPRLRDRVRLEGELLVAISLQQGGARSGEAA
ncbi:hemerythrin domain-containing protein [Stakelama tenebrarum]|uniref:Hemerythrin domain-containing protein n=1 Tax=Stakelama tenebrarum TaxID=2711215 RepID=A0A6G6Y1N7_9SPHN|nr:hemerythrin domain-containing protein [Sphingosinithalassobacter tenebrarum]QIG78820.1 hemerythrin domain-containing protein [Sphingosinithalassobacter tenebrarum]